MSQQTGAPTMVPPSDVGRAPTSVTDGARAAAHLRARSSTPWQRSRPQLAVLTGQGIAGLGNMVFALAAARLLSPRAFSELAAFLALYLAVNLPSNGLTALAALRPQGAARLGRALTAAGASAGLVFAAACVPLAGVLGIPVPLVLCLALACPVTPLLAEARGRLYGGERYGAVVASLVAEPSVRLTLGLGLAGLLGASGAAVGVVAAGMAAFELARRVVRTGPGRRLAGDARPEWSSSLRPQVIAAVMFLVFGLSQNLDLLMANRLLGLSAPSYAALSTLGGIPAFATATVPLVLLRRAGRDRGELKVALLVAGAVGLLGIVVVAPDPSLVVRVLLGGGYHGIASLLPLYFAAMALLGLARVLAVHNLAIGRGGLSLALCVAGVVGQAIAIAAVPHQVSDVAHTTLVTMAVVTIGQAGIALPGTRPWHRAIEALATPVGRTLVVATAVGLAVRLYIPRGIWLDEATSIFEARMSYGAMLNQLYNHDVHPPLYFSLLWIDVHLLGSGQLEVRVVSVLFGLLIVPMAYVAGRDLFDRRTGLVAACLSVVSPLMVWYSQEARMYSMFMLFALVAVWAQAKALREGAFRHWAIWVAAAAALAWTEYFGLFLVAVQVVIFLLLAFRWRYEERGARLRRRGLLAAVALGVLLAPLLAFAYHQFAVNQNAGKGFGGPSQVGAGAAGTASVVNVYTVLANILWALLGYQSNATMADLGALWPLGILACLLVLGRRHRGETKLIVACAFGPLALDVWLATRKSNLLDVRYVSGLAPLLVLLTSRVITGCTRRVGAVLLACGLAAALLTAGLVDQQSNGSNPRRYDFQRALDSIDADYRAGDVLLYDPGDLGQVVSYYAPRERAGPLVSTAVTPPPGGTLFILATRSLMNDTFDKQRLAVLVKRLDHHDHLVRSFSVPNVQVWEFRR